MPTITLCMIAKNEAHCIEDALNSALAVVDQIVLVDTGSTDQTSQIAERFGAEVYYLPWNDSFSEARNESLKHAHGDWILILDADEAIESPRALFDELMAIKTTGPTAYQLKIVNVGDSEHVSPRFFQNHIGLHFQGLIHEQIESKSGVEVIKPAVPQIEIVHHGYKPEEYQRKGKFKRNLDLLQKAIEQEPSNPFHWFNLGITYSTVQDWAQVYSCQMSCLTLAKPDQHYLPIAYASALSACAELGKLPEALDLIEHAPEKCLEFVDFLNNAAHIFMELGALDSAVKFYSKVISLKDTPALYKDIASATWRPYAGIGNAHKMAGNLREARLYYSRALEMVPGHEGLELAIAEIDRQLVGV